MKRFSSKVQFFILITLAICSLAIIAWKYNSFNSTSSIIITHDLHQIEQELDKANKQTLVIFDVDDVLIALTDEVFQRPLDKAFFQKVYTEYTKKYGKERVNYLKSIIFIEANKRLVDPKMALLIKSLQNNNIPTLAITAMSVLNWKDKSPADLRIEELNKFGINFQDGWKNVNINNPDKQNVEDRNRIPLFKGGILFSSNLPKGEVLDSFLQQANFKPKKIIFIDDIRSNLESVQSFCNKNDIQFIGFEYLAAYTRTVPINEARAQYQFKILTQEGRWLSDDVADHRLLKLQNPKNK